MSVKERIISKERQAKSVEECIALAKKYIEENGSCLFLFDAIGSRKYPSRELLQEKLFLLIQGLNTEFDQYLPENNLAVLTRKEKGFYLLGDGSWAGINNADIIRPIVNFIENNIIDVSFRYNVAKDGYDVDALTTIR